MRITKAILTGGGRATRLHPITTTINKHLLPLANKPMIFHAIEKAVEAGITDIFINTNPGDTLLPKYVGDGGHWGVNITYFEQTGGPQGIAHVVNVAKDFIGSDPFMFYLSDNIILGSVKDMVMDFNESDYDCMLALSEVKDPERFGVPIFNDSGTLIDVIEKPKNPPNGFAVTGIYLYGSNVFFDTFENIEKSDRGEYEISSIHSHFLKNNKKVGYKEVTGWWKDTGKMHDLLVANRLLLENMVDDDFDLGGVLPADTVISGNVHIGSASRLGKNVKIIGPVIIGDNCILEDCVIGPNVTLGAGSTIVRASVDNSVLLHGVSISVPKKITKSIIGKNAKIIPRVDEGCGGSAMIVGDKTIIEM